MEVVQGCRDISERGKRVSGDESDVLTKNLPSSARTTSEAISIENSLVFAVSNDAANKAVDCSV